MFKIFSKTNKEEEAIQENTIQDQEDIAVLKEKLEFDASHIKYRVRDDKYLDILLYDNENKPYINTAILSKNKKMIITNNGAISLSNSFVIGPSDKNISSTFKIHLSSDSYNVFICSYDFANYLYITHKKEIEKSYLKVIETLSKIFNDVADNFDYDEVRATEDEERIFDELMQKQAGENDAKEFVKNRNIKNMKI